MKIQYLGTAAAEGVPGMFCSCPVCTEVRRMRDPKNIRTRSQALVDDCLLIDFPPDSNLHFLQHSELDLTALKNVLITHSHADHFYPEDLMLHCPCFSTTITDRLHVYGNGTVHQRCKELIAAAPATFGIAESLSVHQLTPYQTVRIGCHDVTPLLADHMTDEQCYIYVIERDGKTMLYGNDTGIQLCEATWQALFKFRFDLVSLDCTACDRNVARNHMGIPNNRELVHRLAEKHCLADRAQIVLTHFTHHKALSHSQLEQAVAPDGWQVAYDGCTIEF